MDTTVKILVFVFLAILSLALAENTEEAVSNRIDEKPDAADRNARHIQVLGTSPYYPGYSNRYYPSNSYPDRYPVSSYYPTGGSTSFDRYYPSKFDPNYWLSKLPNYPSGTYNPRYPSGTYNPQYPGYPGTSAYPSYPGSNPSYPSGYPGTGGTNFIGYYPSNRYPGHSGYPSTGYPGHSGYPSTGYPGQSGYPTHGGYPTHSGYPSQSGYPDQSGYPSQSGYPTHGNGGYGGYGGNGGYLSYSGYDGYDAAGNRPGNVGYGYHQSRTGGNIIPGDRSPATFPSIVTPSTVSKDA